MVWEVFDYGLHVYETYNNIKRIYRLATLPVLFPQIYINVAWYCIAVTLASDKTI